MALTKSLRISGSFKPHIYISFGFTFLAWMATTGPGVLFLPFIGGPVFLMSAASTDFLKIRYKTIGLILCVLGVAATLAALLLAAASFRGNSNGGIMVDTQAVSPIGVLFSTLAIIFLLVGYIGIWRDYLKPTTGQVPSSAPPTQPTKGSNSIESEHPNVTP